MKITGREVQLELRTTNSPPAFRAVAQIETLGPFSLGADEVEATTLDSPGNFTTFLQTLKDGGEAPVNLMFDPNLVSHWGEDPLSLYELFRTGESRRWRIGFVRFSPPAYFHFEGWIKGFEIGEISHSEPIRINGSIRVTADNIEPQFSFDADIQP